MTGPQENRQSMHKTVITVTDKFTIIWSLITAFVKHYTTFKTITASIEATKMVQMTDSTGVATDKTNKQIFMADKAEIIIGGLKAFAISQSNNELLQKINYSHSAITDARDMDSISYCNIVLAQANLYSTDLEDFNVTAAAISDFETSIINYNAIVQLPRAATVDKKAATDYLVPLFEQASNELKILDGIVDTMKETQIDFYSEYYLAREIIDLGIRHEKPADGE
jgi:hypothetical protein